MPGPAPIRRRRRLRHGPGSSRRRCRATGMLRIGLSRALFFSLSFIRNSREGSVHIRLNGAHGRCRSSSASRTGPHEQPHPRRHTRSPGRRSSPRSSRAIPRPLGRGRVFVLEPKVSVRPVSVVIDCQDLHREPTVMQGLVRSKIRSTTSRVCRRSRSSFIRSEPGPHRPEW